MKRRILCLILAMMLMLGAFPLAALAAYENTYVNTGNQAEDLLGVAMTQSGYMEGSLEGTVPGSNNYTKYGVWWTNETNWGVDYSHSAWCSMFVSWCAAQAQIPSSILYRTAGCDEGVKKSKDRGIWNFSPANGGAYTPKRGDLIYFGSPSDSNHVGIVRSVSSTHVYTIEGNSSNKVSQNSYLLTDGSILGYASPAYADTSGTPQKLADRLESDEKLYIDVSKWQGAIDWTQTANDVDGAILRIGYRASSSRSLIIDPYFVTNYQNAKAAGLPVGCYFYSNALNDEDASQEALWVLDKLRTYHCEMELPVFLDMEDTTMQSLSKTVLTGIARTFCDELLAANWLPGVYMNKSWATSRVDLTAVEDCAVWIAQYNAQCTYAGHYDMWQYSSTGAVAGISGDCDMNRCYVNFEKYIKAKGLNGFAPENPTVIEPEPTVYSAEETYVITAQTGTPVYTSADSNASQLGTLPQDQQIYIYETDDVYGKLIYGAEEGWISLADAVMLKDTAVFGESLGTYTVTATNLNIRSGPGTGYTSLGTLPNGTQVEITALSDIWCKFDYNGADGWLSSNYLAYISKVLLDSNRGTGVNTVCTASVGETVTLPACPYTREGFVFSGWSLTRDGAVQYADGAALTAEKSNKLLYAVWEEQPAAPADAGETYIVTAASTLFVRLGPGTSYDKLGYVTNSTQLYVYETSGNWGKILFEGEDAWISLAYAVPLKDSEPFGENLGDYRVTADMLNVRAGAGTSYAALGTLSKNDVISVTERSGIWCRFNFNGKAGWASAAYMTYLSRILLDSNKGTGISAAVSGTPGSALTLPAAPYTRDGYVLDGWSTEKNGEAEYPCGASLTPESGGSRILYAVWKSDKVAVYPAEHSGTVVNENNMTISGLREGLDRQAFLAQYVTTDENVTVSVSAPVIGTGARVTAVRGDGKTAVYTVVIRGDLNGDGFADGRDAILAQCYNAYYLTFYDLPTGAAWAIDVNNDGTISDADSDLLLNAGVRLAAVEQ